MKEMETGGEKRLLKQRCGSYDQMKDLTFYKLESTESTESTEFVGYPNTFKQSSDQWKSQQI